MNSEFLHKIRWLLFSPDSKVELFFRSLYHRIAATRLHFLWQDYRAKQSYRQWRARQVSESVPDISSFKKQPKVSFILDGSSKNFEQALITLTSIQNLNGSRWEVILVPPEDPPENFPSFINEDPRIQICDPKISDLFDIISGEYVVFCKAGDRFFSALLNYFYQSFASRAGADLIYFDCEVLEKKKSSNTPFFKPGTLSPALLLSVNYLSRSLIKISTLKKVLGSIHPNSDLLVQEYEAALKLCETKAAAVHIPRVLVSQSALVKPNDTAAQDLLVDHLSRQKLTHIAAINESHGTRFTWGTGSPSVAIIIPTRNNVSLLAPLIQSIFKHTSDLPYSLIIVDNNSSDAGTLAYYDKISHATHIKIIPYRKPFNYSEAINRGVSESDSELVLLMNDDMQVITPHWLAELTQWGIRPEIGVVGAKLLRANHTIQHAGIIIGLSGFMGHLYLNAPEHYTGLFGSVDWYRDFLAVTGACQMVRRDVFNEVGGYDEGYKLAFGDIDFCIRIHELGYRNVYTPFATLLHFEGKTRGYITPVDDILKGYTEMETYLVEDDPYFSPNLTYTRIPSCNLQTSTRKDRVNQIATRKKFYTRND